MNWEALFIVIGIVIFLYHVLDGESNADNERKNYGSKY